MPPDMPQSVALNIVGEQVALGPLRSDLLDLYQRWLNDFSTMRNLGDTLRPTARETVAAWYARRTTAPDTFVFLIYARVPVRPIGIAQLQQVDLRNRCAEYVVAIHEPDARGRGYGTEVTRLVLDFAFQSVGLHSVYLAVFAFNHGARRAYEKAGFSVCGRRRAALLLDGRYWDEDIMECLASEYTPSGLGQELTPIPET